MQTRNYDGVQIVVYIAIIAIIAAGFAIGYIGKDTPGPNLFKSVTHSARS
jgi:hypothetical protein